MKLKFDIRNLIASALSAFIIVLIFTCIDFVAHSLGTTYAVPSYYFTNKIIYGTILASLVLYFVNFKSSVAIAISVASIVSILLQTNYYLLGYPLDFVVFFLAVHFIILYAITYFFFEYLVVKTSKYG